MKIYGLKNCDTCRKAARALPDAALVDVRQHPLTQAQVERFHSLFGPALLNTRSTTWRGLSEAEKSEDVVALLLRHPALMKRPVIEGDNKATLGWAQGAQAEWGCA